MGGGQEDLVEVAALEALSPHQLQGTASGELGESPSATLQRASAPGMSVQSVSVAQSPQMAMALR